MASKKTGKTASKTAAAKKTAASAKKPAVSAKKTAVSAKKPATSKKTTRAATSTAGTKRKSATAAKAGAAKTGKKTAASAAKRSASARSAPAKSNGARTPVAHVPISKTEATAKAAAEELARAVNRVVDSAVSESAAALTSQSMMALVPSISRTEATAKAAAEELARAVSLAAANLVASHSADDDAEADAGAIAASDAAQDTVETSRVRAAANSNGTGASAPGKSQASKRPLVRVRRKPSPEWKTYAGPLQALVDIGRQVLGIDNLRPGQAEALAQIMAKRDVLAVMPTGSGKSLLYQLPSLVLPGLTVVVSPLIALIKDQIDKMRERGVAVCRFDSTLTVRQEREALELLHEPGGKLVFTTPERMSLPEFRALLVRGAGGVGVSLFVVDEAHCVSQWGHDFRPSYLTLRKALEELGRPPVLATTATAPPHVREDILHQMGMEDASIITTTFERANLHFEVITMPGEDEKVKTLVTLLKKLPRPGVVYCATVKKVEELYEKLYRHEIPVARYHGRLTKKERDAQQQLFMESKDLVMIATNAFGLGVDKTNIRYVLHYHVPGSLEAYAQEAGRGGRDNKPARCVLLFSPDDVAIQEYFLTGTYPTRRQVRAVYKSLTVWSEDEEAPPTVSNLALSSRVGTQRTRTVLSLLKDEGFVVERDDHTFWLADPPPDEGELNDKARQYEGRRIADRQRLDALLDYVRAPGCRNQVLLAYLGEPDMPECGRCDNCLRSRDAALAAAQRATQLEESVTKALNSEWGEEEQPKPRRVIRHRVIRIDEPGEETEQAEAGAASKKDEAQAETETEAKAKAETKTKTKTKAKAKTETETAQPESRSPAVQRRTRSQAGAKSEATRRRGASSSQMALPLSTPSEDQPEEPRAEAPADSVADSRAPGAAEQPSAATEAAPAASQDETADSAQAVRAQALREEELRAAEAAQAQDAGDHQDEDDEYETSEYEDEYEYDDELAEDEYDEDEYEYDDELAEDEYDEGEYDEDDEEYDEYGDEYEYDDEYEYEDEYDDEEIEAIEKTAAALAEEGLDTSDAEITILARKRVPKPAQGKQEQAAADEDTGKRKRRRRRRRRKKRNLLPPKSAFTSPVLSQPTTSTTSESNGHRSRRGASQGGPVIEYVRGPMRINMTPVASATPNDVAPSRKKKKRRRRRGEDEMFGVEGGAQRVSAGPSDRASRRRRRRRRRRKRSQGAAQEGPVSFFSVQWPGGGSGGEAQSADAPPAGKKRRRRRRRRGRGGRGQSAASSAAQVDTATKESSDSTSAMPE